MDLQDFTLETLAIRLHCEAIDLARWNKVFPLIRQLEVHPQLSVMVSYIFHVGTAVSVLFQAHPWSFVFQVSVIHTACWPSWRTRRRAEHVAPEPNPPNLLCRMPPPMTKSTRLILRSRLWTRYGTKPSSCESGWLERLFCSVGSCGNCFALLSGGRYLGSVWMRAWMWRGLEMPATWQCLFATCATVESVCFLMFSLSVPESSVTSLVPASISRCGEHRIQTSTVSVRNLPLHYVHLCGFISFQGIRTRKCPWVRNLRRLRATLTAWEGMVPVKIIKQCDKHSDRQPRKASDFFYLL